MNDAPIFAPEAFALSARETGFTTRARELAATRFAARAAEYDRAARFPTENYADLRESGLLALCVPAEYGGGGANYREYMLTAAEIGRYCGATALTFNMHVCSCLWSGALADTLDLSAAEREDHHRRRALHYQRIVEDGKVYAQPFSEGGAAAAGAVPFSTTARRVDGGWIVNGKKIFASLSGHADYYGVLCTEPGADGGLSRRNTLYLAVPAQASGVAVSGDWDPLGMRGTVSRTLTFDEVFVAADEALMPPGVYYQAAVRWPHMFMTLTPAYVGLAQAAFDFTVKYLRGEWPGFPQDRRDGAAKRINVAQMRIMLEQMKCLWLQAVTEARIDPTRDQLSRAHAAQYCVMETANELAQLAIRCCGGQSMLKTLPLERLYRDSRCGSLMLPWSADLCLERIGEATLFGDDEE